MLIPFEAFVPTAFACNGHGNRGGGQGDPASPSASAACPFRVIHSVMSDTWVTVTDILQFLPSDDPAYVRFLWASEETGYRHLYLVKAIKACPAADEPAGTQMDDDCCTGICERMSLDNWILS